MKKIIFALVLMMMAALSANAQDGFFRSEDTYRGTTPEPGVDEPLVPHGPLGGALDQDAAPLGSGLLVLTALGAGYLVRKKH